MVPNIGYNFGQKIPCKICNQGQDDQQHLTKCLFLKMRCPELLANNFEYDDIFCTGFWPKLVTPVEMSYYRALFYTTKTDGGF